MHLLVRLKSVKIPPLQHIGVAIACVPEFARPRLTDQTEDDDNIEFMKCINVVIAVGLCVTPLFYNWI